MMKWAFGFLIIALVAAILGFGGIAVRSSEIARISFFIFILGFVMALAWGMAKRRKNPTRDGRARRRVSPW